MRFSKIFDIRRAEDELDIFNKYYRIHFPFRRSTIWKIFILLDVIKSHFQYRARTHNYFIFEFYKKSRYERRKFITDEMRYDYWEVLHKSPILDISNKFTMYKMYHQFLGRDFIYICNESKDSFLNFCENKTYLFAKPNKGLQGIGAKKINLSEHSNIDKLYEELVDGDYVVEEFIEQHEAMAQFHPFSLNTFRITTIIKDNSIHILSAVIRMGNDKQVVDNYSAGGIVASVDINSGIISSAGVTQSAIDKFLFHPITGKQIIGFKIPLWDEIIELVRKMAIVNSDIGYVGWDIALSKKGPVLVEANFQGGFNLQQSPLQIGLKEKYDKIVFGK